MNFQNVQQVLLNIEAILLLHKTFSIIRKNISTSELEISNLDENGFLLMSGNFEITFEKSKNNDVTIYQAFTHTSDDQQHIQLLYAEVKDGASDLDHPDVVVFRNGPWCTALSHLKRNIHIENQFELDKLSQETGI